MDPTDIASPTRKCTKCHWNHHAPEGHDYLMVSGSDIELITNEHGLKTSGYWRVIDKLFLNISESLFDDCRYWGLPMPNRRCQPRVLRVMRGLSVEKIREREETPKLSPWRWFHRRTASEQGTLAFPSLEGKGLILRTTKKLSAKNKDFGILLRVAHQPLSRLRQSQQIPHHRSHRAHHRGRIW